MSWGKERSSLVAGHPETVAVILSFIVHGIPNAYERGRKDVEVADEIPRHLRLRYRAAIGGKDSTGTVRLCVHKCYVGDTRETFIGRRRERMPLEM